MRSGRYLRTAVTVCAVAALAACGDGEANAPGPDASVSQTGSSASVPRSTDARPPVDPTASQPPAATNSPIPPGTSTAPAEHGLGTLVLHTVTLQGVAVPNVPVYVARHAPCDPASGDLPETAAEVERWADITDVNGEIMLTVPVGCYRFGMEPPPGTVPVPEGMHTLFLTAGGRVVTGLLRFEDPAAAPSCATETIVRDLDVGGDLSGALATVSECHDSWAVIAWDVPGDSQRVVRLVDSRWTTYVVFPHDRCWSQARTDGAPSALEVYFSVC